MARGIVSVGLMGLLGLGCGRIDFQMDAGHDGATDRDGASADAMAATDAPPGFCDVPDAGTFCCPDTEDCSYDCPAGGCDASCGANSDCTLACGVPGCSLSCEGAMTCTLDCGGGNIQRCNGGGMCRLTC